MKTVSIGDVGAKLWFQFCGLRSQLPKPFQMKMVEWVKIGGSKWGKLMTNGTLPSPGVKSNVGPSSLRLTACGNVDGSIELPLPRTPSERVLASDVSSQARKSRGRPSANSCEWSSGIEIRLPS